MCDPVVFREALAQLRAEPQTRHSIGFWQNNCDNLLSPRNYVIDVLRASGLNVRSVGACRRTVSEDWLGRVANSSGGKVIMGQAMDPDTGRIACHEHRLMLVAQHSTCDDYVTNICKALSFCGAIPILLQVEGTPDYAGLYGAFPHVNASRPDWLHVVKRLMHSDDAYEAFIRDGLAAASQAQPSRAGWREAYHCDWHGVQARARASHAQPAALSGRRTPFPACKACDEPRWGAAECPQITPWHVNAPVVRRVCHHRVSPHEERNASSFAAASCHRATTHVYTR